MCEPLVEELAALDEEGRRGGAEDGEHRAGDSAGPLRAE
jgi:hypothetical protein